jgi:hypothetical protein
MKAIRKVFNYIPQAIKWIFQVIREDFENRKYYESLHKGMTAHNFNEDFYEENGQVKVRWVKKSL